MPVMSLLGAIVFYAFAFVALCTFVFGGVSFSQYQTKINKRKFGKVALTISLVCLAASIIGTLVIIFTMYYLYSHLDGKFLRYQEMYHSLINGWLAMLV